MKQPHFLSGAIVLSGVMSALLTTAVTTAEDYRVSDGIVIAVPDPAVHDASLISQALDEEISAAAEKEVAFQTVDFVEGQLIDFQPPPEPEQPIIPVSAVTSASFSPFGTFDLGLESADDTQRIALPSSAPADVALGYVSGQTLVRDTRDVGSLLWQAPTVTGVYAWKRPAATKLFIRGYNPSQIYTQLNGGYWLEARADLDTIVSKIDSGIVEDVVVIKGPYSALYGPGLAFVDVVTSPTIRANCCEKVTSRYRTVFTQNQAGRGYYARQVADVGGVNWGARANFGFRGMVDYRAGNGDRIDADYLARDIDFALGYDLANGGKIQFQFLRLDMDDTIFSNQPAAIDALVTNGFTLRYKNDCAQVADKVVVEGWYNMTRIAQNSGTLTAQSAQGTQTLTIRQDTDQFTAGARAALTYGDAECCGAATTVGADFRYSEQEIIEFDQGIFNGNFDLPDSDVTNPGLFIQREVRNCNGRLQYGGRLDYVRTHSIGDTIVSGFGTDAIRDRDFTLFSLFLTGERYLNDVWSFTFGAGHGRRAPNTTELYTNETLIAIPQKGLAYLVGNPNLQDERATQFDIGLKADYCTARLGVRGYYTYVENYVTYSTPFIIPVFPQSLFDGHQFVNSDSYFAGVEFNGEYDINCNWTAFGLISYTYGQDVGRFNEPVYAIYPFDSRAGLRWQRGDACRGIGVEFSARMIASQDRFATKRAELPTSGFATMDLISYIRVSPGILLTVGVQNLADQLVLEHYDYKIANGGVNRGNGFSNSYQPGRNFYVGGEFVY